MLLRHEIKELEKRIREKRRFIQVIVGPRQVGKTTMVKQLLKRIDFPGAYASADNIPNADNIWLQEEWEIARVKQEQNKSKDFVLVIDEIQKVYNWSEAVKALWDYDTQRKSRLKIILLGSSRLLLQQGLTESLAGRFELHYLSHWSFSEMHKEFGLTAEQFAWFGGYPGSAELISDEERWKKYVHDSLIETSISKDVLMLTRVDKPALLRKLFEIGCLYSGQILSYTKMLGQLLDAGNTTTLSHYLNLLDTAGLLAGVEKFAPNQIRQRSSSPKFQVHNSALISAQRNESFRKIQTQPEEWGRIVESAIGAHLINYARSRDFKVSYWRNRNDEIDFVIEKRGTVIGLEIKSGNTNRASGMAAFQKQMKPDKVMLIGKSGMPWQEFLKINPAELF